MACVYIPVQNSEEEVRVALDQLPRDASDIVDILKAEQAPLDLWLIIAREYFKQGKIEQFRLILEEGSSPDIDEYYADVRYERIAILNALGAYYSYLGKIEAKQKEKEEYFIKATQYYNRASRIDMHEPSTWVGKGQLLLAKGDVEQAFAAFKIVLDGDRDNVPALLGQACVHFNRGRYSDSLELYKRALQVFPQCPAAVRLGIGLCRYKLGQFEKAKQAFERVLQLDNDNSDALVALAIMDLQSKNDDSIKLGMEKMKKAFDIYPYCAMSLNYLADHFFFTGQHKVVQDLTETALVVTNHGPTKSHAYYNLARSYHDMGDFEKAGMYYMQSVKENTAPREFVLPYYGLGQVQLKLGDLKSALTNFEKILEVHPDNCDTLKALGHIYIQLGQVEKAHEFLRKATKVDSHDPQAFLDLGELLIPTDTGAALDAFKTARNLLKNGNTKKKDKADRSNKGRHEDEVEEVPVELLNNIGVLHFERGEFELAEQAFRDALGDGIWLKFLDDKAEIMSADKKVEDTGADVPDKDSSKKSSVGEELSSDPEAQVDSLRTAQFPIDATASVHLYKDLSLFDRLEEQGIVVELPFNKVSTLFNLARLLEQLHHVETASIFYRLILYKYPDYPDAYLRLAAIAKARSNVTISTELLSDALKVDEKCQDALLMLGDLELKNDDWVKAKETFRAAKDMSDGDDSYASLCLGNWNYFAAIRSEKRAPKLEATHLEKAKELYSKVLLRHTGNLYAANGTGIVLAEKGQFDISKELFTQVQEAASGSVFVQMPDVWINLAHVHFAQGNFSLAVKMYQNCLRKFYYNTDSQVLLYLARTHYEAEQWQDCRKTLLRAIHLAPANYTLRFDIGAALQKFSSSTLQKEKRTTDELLSTIAELRNAVRVFSLMAASSNLHVHGFDEKKIETHVEYCKHLLEAAKVHYDAAERVDLDNKRRQEANEIARVAQVKQREAEERARADVIANLLLVCYIILFLFDLLINYLRQREKRKHDEEQKLMREQDLLLQRKKEQWSTPATKRKDRSQNEDEERHGEKKKKGGKRRKREKKAQYESDEAEPMEDQDEIYSVSHHQDDDKVDQTDGNPQDLFAAAGLEDSDAEEDTVPSNASRRRQAWSSDED
ncbi:OLC1v1037856C1 [Oldenlandia corymbosa var. corymbosa]|uniref:OLC1v1037856C1 n=1 Tax=Oldenlandia corymbosa var. corymbosa TaxID=529605 RepID=A0AAV1CZ26_OLDCO|nr:OLC1v1037856C1 [Oldenlandia corymbosa var. corymbosa]